MRILAERDGLYFLDLDCQGCGSQTVAIVTIEMDDAEASIADLSIVPLTALSATAMPFLYTRTAEPS